MKAYLPYGIALTLIFREFGVALEGETTKVMHSDTYFIVWGIKS